MELVPLAFSGIGTILVVQWEHIVLIRLNVVFCKLLYTSLKAYTLLIKQVISHTGIDFLANTATLLCGGSNLKAYAT
jgi:hypothetical protein